MAQFHTNNCSLPLLQVPSVAHKIHSSASVQKWHQVHGIFLKHREGLGPRICFPCGLVAYIPIEYLVFLYPYWDENCTIQRISCKKADSNLAGTTALKNTCVLLQSVCFPVEWTAWVAESNARTSVICEKTCALSRLCYFSGWQSTCHWSAWCFFVSLHTSVRESKQPVLLQGVFIFRVATDTPIEYKYPHWRRRKRKCVVHIPVC